MNSMEKQMSGYSYSEANPFANEYADELQRTMKRKEMNISRKHISMSEPLKPDTPPVSISRPILSRSTIFNCH